MLVCTDAAARGLDIPAVSHIVQADFASTAVDFLHRVNADCSHYFVAIFVVFINTIRPKMTQISYRSAYQTRTGGTINGFADHALVL